MSPMWQKGNQMNNGTYCRTLKLAWHDVGILIADYIGQLLGRKVYGTANYEGSDYWDFCAKSERFSVSELDRLVSRVNGDKRMRCETIPSDSEDSYSIGMRLSCAILERALRLSWNHMSMSETALWLVNVREIRPTTYKRVIDVGAHTIVLDELKSKDDTIAYLHENGPTHSTLMDFCEEYRERYHNELCWSYPISDGKHLGTFFLLVREGVLSLPYDDADKVDYELFCLDDARLCDKDSMSDFIDDWDTFERDLRSAMQSILAFYRREEEHDETAV